MFIIYIRMLTAKSAFKADGTTPVELSVSTSASSNSATSPSISLPQCIKGTADSAVYTLKEAYFVLSDNTTKVWRGNGTKYDGTKNIIGAYSIGSETTQK